MKHIKTKHNQHIMHQSKKMKSPFFFYKMDSKKNILFKKAFTDNDHKERSKAFVRRESSD